MNIFSRIAAAAGGSRGAKISLAVWLLLAIALSVAAPSAKQYGISAGEGSAGGDSPAQAAQRLLDEQFPSAKGQTALLVFRSGGGPIPAADQARIADLSRWLSSDAKPEEVAAAVPFDRLTDEQRRPLFSADGTTLLLSVTLKEGLESDRTLDTLDAIKAKWTEAGATDAKLELTGPAAIAADTLTLFRNADFVLMIATVLLILVLLVVIYRSPLLAIIPLAIAGLVYAVADRLIGLAGRAGWITIDKQSLSIMMILLFAVLTDYSLFVFSRFREELRAGDSKYEAMKRAMRRVAEPIAFSGGTVLIAMLALFLAAFMPYHGFAPVFAIAVVVILAAGLTLVPAAFAIAGRKAFWPFAPKAGALAVAPARAERAGFWARTGRLATTRPKLTFGVLALLLALAALNVSTLKYSFNLMKSFPADTPSRVGFETLESRYPPGRLAPVTVLLTGETELPADDPGFAGKVRALADELSRGGAVASVAPDPAAALPDSAWSQDRRSLKLQLVLSLNPYDQAALDAVQHWRGASEEMLRASGFDPNAAKLSFAGQTAEQLDVRDMNKRDTIVIFSVISLCILLMLAWQTRSLKLSLAMIGTILLSFAAAIGLSWAVFRGILGYGQISYRIPMYTFVFMVALGVDYNIMLVSRIREEAERHPWAEAIRRGVASTGGVISSAGLILAATFGVLMTQPMQELFLFGFAMAAGILIDTFVVRGMLLPSLLTLLLPPKRSPSSKRDRTPAANI